MSCGWLEEVKWNQVKCAHGPNSLMTPVLRLFCWCFCFIHVLVACLSKKHILAPIVKSLISLISSHFLSSIGNAELLSWMFSTSKTGSNWNLWNRRKRLHGWEKGLLLKSSRATRKGQNIHLLLYLFTSFLCCDLCLKTTHPPTPPYGESTMSVQRQRKVRERGECGTERKNQAGAPPALYVDCTVAVHNMALKVHIEAAVVVLLNNLSGKCHIYKVCYTKWY